MTYRRRAIVLLAATLLFTVFGPGRLGQGNRAKVDACYTVVEFPVFTPVDSPDVPSFVEGRLGILQPGYRWRYRLAAWRILNGHPLSALERRAYQPAPAGSPPEDAVQIWLKARSTALGASGVGADVPERHSRINRPDVWSYVLNCGDSAFATAVTTLQERQRMPGATADAVRDWVRAQDTVFANCGRMGNGGVALPAALPATAPALARADRDYQRAAAQFYGGNFLGAEQAFTSIASDRSSPWRSMAPYLAARAVIRQATLGGSDAKGDLAALQRADGMLEAILRDPSRRAIHEATSRLRGAVTGKLRPRAALQRAVDDLADPAAQNRFADRLADAEYLLRRVPSVDVPNEPDPVATTAGGDLLDWLDNVGGVGDDGFTHALERWTAGRSNAWLVAAMMQMPPDHADAPRMLSAAATIAETSPAFPTVAFHRARVLLRLRRVDEARDVLDRALAQPGLPDATINLFRAARLITARTVDEFVSDAPRRVVHPSDPEYQWVSGRAARTAAGLDHDAIGLVNERMPLAMLRQLAEHPRLTSSVRQDLRLAAFTRAFLVDDLSAVRALVPGIVGADPTIRAAIGGFDRLDDDRLRDEFAIMLLRAPGLRPLLPGWSYRDPVWRGSPNGLQAISGWRDNWWCRVTTTAGEAVPQLRRAGAFEPVGTDMRPAPVRYSEPQRGLHGDDTRLPHPAFITANDRRLALDEWERLKTVETAPNELGRRGLDWARRNPDDPRVPEVLHRIVQAVRWGCSDDASGAIARSAFEQLHARYARSAWAARTPYWYR